ncbi:MAG: hypothetical protein MZV70_46640 [Desulfobacterales bacterium]|nr:hypothetical protein [Desulfobacterales bacterium]
MGSPEHLPACNRNGLTSTLARAHRLHLVSLGCAKNQVDSEFMLGRLQLAAAGPSPTIPEEAHAIVVNTRAVSSSPPSEESIETIVESGRIAGQAVCCRRLVVTGRLPERYREKIVQALPEVDVVPRYRGLSIQIVAGGPRTRVLTCPRAMSLPDLGSEPARTWPERAAGAVQRPLRPTSKSPRYGKSLHLPHHRPAARPSPQPPPEDILAEARELAVGGVASWCSSPRTRPPTARTSTRRPALAA